MSRVRLGSGSVGGTAGLDQATADSLYVNVTGDTMTGNLTVAPPTGVSSISVNAPPGVGADVTISSDSGKTAGLTFRTGTENRWRVVKDGGVETGGNSGSNFAIQRYDDNGASLTVLSIGRSTGLITVSADPTLALGIATKQYADAVLVTAMKRIDELQARIAELERRP